MERIFHRFANRTIKLTFRLLPSAGATPWMVGGGAPKATPGDDSKHENPILQKFPKSVSPWFSKKQQNEDALKEVLDLVEDEETEEEEDVLQAVEDDDDESGVTMEELLEVGEDDEEDDFEDEEEEVEDDSDFINKNDAEDILGQ